MTAEAREAPDPHPGRPKARKYVEFAFGLGLAAVLIVWGLPIVANTSWSQIGDIVSRVPLIRSVEFQLLMLAGLYSYTYVITGSLSGISHRRALIVNLCGSSVSNLLPGGGAVGLAATFYICRSWGFSRAAVSSMALVSGIWNVLARIALPVIALLMLWVLDARAPAGLRNVAWVAAIVGATLIALFLAMMLNEGAANKIGAALQRLLHPLLRLSAKTRNFRVDRFVRDTRASTIDVVSRSWASMTAGMVGFFGLYYVLFVLVMNEVGVHMNLGLLFAAFAIGRLMTAIGVTPGGAGFTESATVAAMVAWGADGTSALAGVLLFSVYTQVMEIPLGGIGWLLWSASKKTGDGGSPRGARRQPRATPDTDADTDADSGAGEVDRAGRRS